MNNSWGFDTKQVIYQMALAFVAGQESMPANKYEWAGSLVQFNANLIDMLAAQHEAFVDHMRLCNRPQIICLGPSTLETKPDEK